MTSISKRNSVVQASQEVRQLKVGAKPVWIQNDYFSQLKGLSILPLGPGWTLENAREFVKAQLQGNRVDEAIIQDSKGALHLVFADSLPAVFRQGAKLTGEVGTKAHAKLTAKIVSVSREADRKAAKPEVIKTGLGFATLFLAVAEFPMAAKRALTGQSVENMAFNKMAQKATGGPKVPFPERDLSRLDDLIEPAPKR
jgi:hypothetical protein